MLHAGPCQHGRCFLWAEAAPAPAAVPVPAMALETPFLRTLSLTSMKKVKFPGGKVQLAVKQEEGDLIDQRLAVTGQRELKPTLPL